MSLLSGKSLATTAWPAALAAAPIAHAVHLDPGGRGQALIYPYYTVQSASGNAFNTYLSVVNWTPEAKVIRVRFREGRNGREVAGFNLYLHGGDTWAAALVPTASGTRLLTVDKSCVNGPFVGGGESPVRSYDFSNAGYSGAADDGLGSGLDRTREGYVEMIEMATLTGPSGDAVSLPPNDFQSDTPANCPAVQGASVPLQTAAPSGGLSGTLTLINVANGMDFTVDAVALAQLSTSPFYRDVGDPYPDFDSAEVTPVSHFVSGGASYRATFATGAEAVASTLVAESLGNETVMDTGTRSGTDWIVTLPFRRFGIGQAPWPPTAYPPSTLEGNLFHFTWGPRDGRARYLFPCEFSPCPQVFDVSPRLPWAATVVTFSREGPPPSSAPVTLSTVLGSTNAVLLKLWTPSYESGSGSMSFRDRAILGFQGTSMGLQDGAVSSVEGNARGMPAVGFMVRTFENGQISCGSIVCQANYGGAFPHTTRSADVFLSP